MQKNSRKNKVLIVGGHAGSTAIATIEALKKIIDSDIYFVGGKSSIEGKNSRTLAQVAFDDMNVTTLTLETGRIQTKLSWQTIPSLLKIPAGFISAYFLIKKVKPDIILSFGGYVAPPVVFASWLARIPVVVHEQTSLIGRANKFSIPFASKIALARPSSQKYFPKDKTVVIGNPIPEGVINTKRNKIHNPPHILVTGGASGSVAINTFIENILIKLLEDFMVVHQTGDLDYTKFRKLKNKLPKSLYERYEVFSVINPSLWAKYLEWADIFVARSGANFTYQLLVVKKPAVLIPLPFTHLDEQIVNALYAQKFGAAHVVDQLRASPKDLLLAIHKLGSNWNNIVSNLQNKVSPDIGASNKLAEMVVGIIKKSDEQIPKKKYNPY